MAKYIVRFHRDAWTDIVVEAPDEDEAYEQASDKYNAGEYEDSDEDFNNTNVEFIKVR